jgi:phosphoribosylformylglycinamidine cyclo-ligase
MNYFIDIGQFKEDIEAGYEVVRRIRSHARSTYRPEVLNNIGSFGGFFALDTAHYRNPTFHVTGASLR